MKTLIKKLNSLRIAAVNNRMTFKQQVALTAIITVVVAAGMYLKDPTSFNPYK